MLTSFWKNNLYLIACQLFIAGSLYAQENTVEYVRNYIGVDQGLSHNYVTSVVSDEHNNKWIGTENGITVYNGYDFEYIKPSLGFAGLENENIEVLFRDSENNIWIGTKSGGISSINTRNNQVTNYNHLIDPTGKGNFRVTSIAESAEGHIWVGTWDLGVFIIDQAQHTLINNFKHNPPIYNITRGRDNDMWYVYGRFLVHDQGENEKQEVFNLNTTLSDVLFDSFRNRVWISCGKFSSTLFYYDYISGNIDSLQTEVVSNFSKTLSLDAENTLWIGTWGYGLYRSNQDLTSFKKVNILPPGSERISRNYEVILDIHHDRNKQTWIATATAGVVKLIPQIGFINLSSEISENTFKGDFNITAIYRDQKAVFFGTLKSGLFTGSDMNSLKQVAGLEETKIFKLYIYDDQLFVGTDLGLVIYDLTEQKISYENTALKKVTEIFIDEAQMVYLGTQQDGLAMVPLAQIRNPDLYVFYNDNREDFGKIESDRISGIGQDHQGNIWISTFNGIHLYDKATKTFIHHSQLMDQMLPSVIINQMVIRNNIIWLGTPSGLIGLEYLDKESRLTEKSVLTARSGLKNDFICAMIFDEKEALWLATNTEIIKFDPVSGSFFSYGDLEGIKTSSFNNRSFFNYENKVLYFGGVDNVTYFNPQTISANTGIPQVFFSSLRVNNEDITSIKVTPFLDQTIGYAEKINLSSSDKFFAVGFTTNDFLGKLNVKYRYKLTGYQNEWIDLQNKNEINFANLPPGNYVLNVAATRDNQQWSEPNTIAIEVLPSLWLSPWAYFVYLVFMGLGVYTYYKFKKRQLQLKADLQIIQIEKEKDFALNEAKLNFFTNISHEFRTPLTLMMGPLHELTTSAELSEKMQKKVNIIERNSNKLLNLINQLLDFRKAEHGLLRVNASEGNFVRFSREVFLYFTEFASQRRIKYEFISEKEEIRFPFDRNKMEIVLCNLISNALKHCSPGDSITLNLYEESGNCIVSIKDTGEGMDTKFLDKIFDRYYQIKSSNTSRMVGSGIGLAFSKKIIELHHGSISVNSERNEGSEFIIILEMDPELYKEVLDDSFVHTDNIKAYDIRSPDEFNNNLSLQSKENSILIIDDNTEILDYLNDILQDDYEVWRAESGEEGYELALEKVPDIIVSDIMMPGKDGITLCKELKSHINTSHIPVILLTARTSTVFEIEGLKTGADDYVTKPFNPLIVKARISSILDNRTKMRQHFVNKVRFEPTLTDANPKEDAENAFIQKAMQLVEANLQNDEFGIDHMTDEFYMSQSTLYRKIRSLTGLSLSGFIRSVRLKKAAVLILTTNMNLNEVAYDVGFNDYKYFNSCFKKQFECLPSQYREKYAKAK